MSVISAVCGCLGDRRLGNTGRTFRRCATPFKDRRVAECAKHDGGGEAFALLGTLQGALLYCFQDIANYLSKVAHFSYRMCPIWMTPLQFHQDFWRQKLDSLQCRVALFNFVLSHFDRTTACDRHRAIAYTALG